MTQRMTDEQARILADGDYEPVVQIGIGTTINVAHLAADLLDERNLNRALQRENVIYDGFVTIGEQGGLHPFGSWSSNLHGAWVTVCIRYEPKP